MDLWSVTTALFTNIPEKKKKKKKQCAKSESHNNICWQLYHSISTDKYGLFWCQIPLKSLLIIIIIILLAHNKSTNNWF